MTCSTRSRHCCTAGMTGLPYDAFDTLKAVRPSLRSHASYGSPCFPTLAACSARSRHRCTAFAAQQPSLRSHMSYGSPLLLFLCGFAQPNTGGIWIRLHRGIIQRGEIRTMCTNSNAQSHWRSSMRRPSGNRHTRDRVSVAVCEQRPKRATTDQRPTSMVASRAA